MENKGGEGQGQSYNNKQQLQYAQVMSQAAYGYHIDPQWLAHQSSMHPHQYHPAYGYQYPVQHMEGVPLPPGIPGLGGSTDPLEAVLGPFPCARLRNMPYDATMEDILMLFQGLVLIDIVLVGQGEAYVLFANPMDFQMALQRNRQTIGRRFVDITPSSRNEYYEAVAKLHEQEIGTSKVGMKPDRAKLENTIGDEQQPSGETASTVAALWGHAQIPPQPMQSFSGQSGGFMEGMGRQPSPALSLPASRVVPGSSTTRGTLHAPLQKRTGGGIQVGEHTGFLRMRGLPFSAAKEDIVKFFEGFNPIPESIVLTYRNDGRATGEAYIGFMSPEDAERAMDLHRRTMGSRYIELFISNKEEQGRALARFGSR